MIESREDLKEYIRCDKIANKIETWKQEYVSATFEYIKIMRKLEYYTNLDYKIWAFIYRILLRRISLKTGITIPINVFGKGLYIPHHGTIVVNGSCRFGDWCQIQCGVNISAGSTGGGTYIFAREQKLWRMYLLRMML